MIKTNFDRDVVLDLSTREKEFENEMFPLNIVFDSGVREDWADGYKEFHGYSKEFMEKYKQFRTDVLDTITGYKLPVITLGKETPREAVCKVFENVNTGGVPLTVFELVTATFATYEFDLRKDWEECRNIIWGKNELLHTDVMYGVDETISTVEDWLNIDLSYYLKLNFSSMRGIINAIGGIDVYSPVEFDSDISEYHYDQGWNHLNGKQALYFARERHAFEGQDSVRVENQQRVVKAVIKKMTSSPAVLLKYGEIMEVAGSNLATNMSYDEIQDLIKMQMTDLASWDVQTQKIEGEYDMDYVASLSSKNKYSVYRPDPESVQKCLDKIYDVMHPTSAEIEKAEKDARRGFIESIIKKARNRVKNGETDELEEEEG